MVNGICLGNRTIDCKDAVTLCDFYGGLLGWEPCVPDGLLILRSLSGLVLLSHEADFDYSGLISPVWPEESGEQQKKMHFDFHVENLPHNMAADSAM